MRYFLVLFALTAGACWALTSDETAMLQSPEGWEYQTITDPGNGFQTQGTCFTQDYTGQCRGELIFHTDGTFRQDLSAHGKSEHRGGRYEVKDDQITFWDEHDTQDGPYQISLDLPHKTLHLNASHAGVGIDMTLLLKSEFKKRMAEKK